MVWEVEAAMGGGRACWRAERHWWDMGGMEGDEPAFVGVQKGMKYGLAGSGIAESESGIGGVSGERERRRMVFIVIRIRIRTRAPDHSQSLLIHKSHIR